ncbi:MAG: TrkA family potassium uptake protein [Firmicutes bacterium]|nr:TrkA family potassium uptake protein [Bacillota bacterium]MCL1954050.1 TrkA family potassium uptake protein [Bacillota bacterium]
MKKKKISKKSILIIGMGRFGLHLALKFLELGNTVMAVDSQEKIIENLPPIIQNVMIADCTSEKVLESLGVSNFDLCFVTIGDNFEACLVITSLLKSIKAKHIIAKASSNMQIDILKKIGANEVIYPERDLANKTAIRFNFDNILDFTSISQDYAIYDLVVPFDWVGKTVGDINIRQKYGINILGVKKGSQLYSLPGALYCFGADDILVVMAKLDSIEQLAIN